MAKNGHIHKGRLNGNRKHRMLSEKVWRVGCFSIEAGVLPCSTKEISEVVDNLIYKLLSVN